MKELKNKKIKIPYTNTDRTFCTHLHQCRRCRLPPYYAPSTFSDRPASDGETDGPAPQIKKAKKKKKCKVRDDDSTHKSEHHNRPASIIVGPSDKKVNRRKVNKERSSGGVGLCELRAHVDGGAT